MHEGHRKRLKARLKEEGLEHFSEINILELLLFYSIPRRDTNPIAHALLDKYDNLANVLEAEFDDLLNVDGITENSASLITMLVPLYRRYMSIKSQPGRIIEDLADAAEYLTHTYLGEKNEVVKLMAMDSKGKLIGTYRLFEGNFNSVDINMRRLVETVILSKASSVILAHNHPDGIALPSEQDVATTRKIFHVLKDISVDLLDHIIIADGDFVSIIQGSRAYER
ncbi:MAG: RadC family protein [Clostridia bacterium]|nr:RadC family protein [Clostridia bacterium]MBQ1375246.1 RadC family protein [Clostridia bacterium]MBQ4249447.1 RadC family protein [Clostridia bacterium]